MKHGEGSFRTSYPAVMAGGGDCVFNFSHAKEKKIIEYGDPEIDSTFVVVYVMDAGTFPDAEIPE